MNKVDKIKSILKRPAASETFGTNPADPWSTKANIAEFAGTPPGMLAKYLKSRGINPKFASKEQKIAHSKTGQFQKWQRDHQDRASLTGTTFKVESVDKKDTVTFDIPLLIRVLELAREDIKSDMDLHRVVERLINIRNKGMLTMDDYDTIAAIKESVAHSIPTNYIKEALTQLNAESKESNYGGDYQDSVKALKAKAEKKPVDMKSLAARMQASYAKDNKPVKKEGYEHGFASPTGGLHQRKREDDEYHNEPKPKFRERTMMDRPHTVHIDNRPWKKFDNGHQAHAAVKTLTSKGKNAVAIAHFKEDTYQDPQAATQMPFDGANNPNDVTPPEYKGKRLIQMSKSARIIKSLYKKKGVAEGLSKQFEIVHLDQSGNRRRKIVSGTSKEAVARQFKKQHKLEIEQVKQLEQRVAEDTYDFEKADKSVASYGKPPKVAKTDKAITDGDKEQAAIVLSGGKTLTGDDRDTVEIDPKMKMRPNQPEPTKNSKPQIK